ncbi:hypothetical protein CC86DRAFT_412027 [Ophiobolus disseminans]|uniref:Uncharacterized protein n=1 Tax=Ophiobolus disseminans TaxID=1469910 RepID=A0A6A6ZKG3_9PLEO|nr:hypothetical protein CC86DRAFT_412027 [Ophiobolus disseminans]
MKPTVLAALTLLSTSTSANVVFSLASEPRGQGDRRSWLVDRWKCKPLAPEGFDKQASWAFVDIGLANGCSLYEEGDCTGEQLWVEKNNSNVLGPGPVNLTDFGWDKRASGFQCF